MFALSVQYHATFVHESESLSDKTKREEQKSSLASPLVQVCLLQSENFLTILVSCSTGLPVLTESFSLSVLRICPFFGQVSHEFVTTVRNSDPRMRPIS